MQSLYTVVVREALNFNDLQYLNADMLRPLWKSLTLPDSVRQQWEMKFPELR